MRRIESQIDLPAEAWVVWDHLVDAESIGSWNPFITSIAGVFEAGEQVTVRIAPVGGRPITFKPRVTVVEPGRRLEWFGTMGIRGLFDGRHSFTLTPVAQARTRLVQAEDFSGLLIPFTGALLTRTQAGFAAMNAALLTRLTQESVAADGTGNLGQSPEASSNVHTRH